MTTKLNLIQKLIEVRKAVPYLKKDNAGFQFKFVSSSQTLAALKGAMDEQGVLLVPSVTETKVSDHTTKKGNHEYFTILTMVFKWIDADNPTDFLESPWVGQGLDDAEKGVGKALTYAEKYFLLKFFNIPTDKDDPDTFQQKRGPVEEAKRIEEPQAPPDPTKKADTMMQEVKNVKNETELAEILKRENFRADYKILSEEFRKMILACIDNRKMQLTITTPLRT